MTNIPSSALIEQELRERLGALAAAFVADLEAQGRIVGPGGAIALEQLRTHVEARKNLPPTFQLAVDTIIDDCGYPRDAAVRVVTALQRKRLLCDDGEPESQHAFPSSSPDTSPVRGARVVQIGRPRPPFTAVPITPVAATPVDRPAAWTAAQARAVTLASRLREQHGEQAGVTEISPDRERVGVAIRAASLDDWTYWLTAIGAPLELRTWTAGYAQMALGSIDGVETRLVAHDVPRLLRDAELAAGEPYFLWGRMYDLSRGQLDSRGITWLYLGQRQENGMPLLTVRGGASALYPLTSIVVAYGHLTPVDAARTAPAAEQPAAPAGGEE
ncbi:BN159_2729 family protein [Streptomyces sp. NPDC096080]|uniref:BN159_2729 family protein n=1 Tax=Streptomyces sp. NPDC096080 TaxID=3156693 RepID=UPI00332E7CC9